MFFSNILTIISILLAILLFLEGAVLQSNVAANNNNPQIQVSLTFHLTAITLFRLGAIIGGLVTISFLRVVFSSDWLLRKHRWLKKNQPYLFIMLDILLVGLLVVTYLLIRIYS